MKHTNMRYDIRCFLTTEVSIFCCLINQLRRGWCLLSLPKCIFAAPIRREPKPNILWGMDVNCYSVREVGHYSYSERPWFSKSPSARRKRSLAERRQEPRGSSTCLQEMSLSNGEAAFQRQTMAAERKSFSVMGKVWTSWQCCPLQHCVRSPHHTGLININI